MYRMYTEDCHQRHLKPVSETLYRHVFHNDFNLKFKQPAKDTCSRCDAFNVQLAPLRQQKGDDIAERIKQVETEKEEHHCAAQLARDSLVADRHEAKDSSKTVSVITFDLQSALPTPSLTTNVVYYKRQLMVYNLGIHNCKDESARMNVWHEGQASRGAQEVSINQFNSNLAAREPDSKLL